MTGQNEPRESPRDSASSRQGVPFFWHSLCSEEGEPPHLTRFGRSLGSRLSRSKGVQGAQPPDGESEGERTPPPQPPSPCRERGKPAGRGEVGRHRRGLQPAASRG